MRERKVLADIEQALVQEEPRLARQLARMRLTHRTEEPPAPPGEPPAAAARAKEQTADEPAVPKYVWENEPGTVARRFARWCAALALVLLVVSDLAASSDVLYAAGATALVSGVACMVARSAARRE
ncbi:hypothetical protein [Actinacidiphila acidipaludis]|uniref:hypothetical protein n=1 Tax=Actinacidiphila acidipaludis TaxID=2873382 RepID=UPI0027DEEC7C|nr:hypothetical protein [Streptomyces acidipaludis]